MPPLITRARRRSIRPSSVPSSSREEARDPDSFKSEYLAQFTGSGAAFLDPEDISEAVTLPGPLQPQDALRWVAGLDPAFSSDPFGLVLVGHDPVNQRRLVVGHVQAWKPARRKPVSFEESRKVEDSLVAEVAAVCRRFNARAITDQYKAAGVADRLRALGVSVKAEPMTAPRKDEAFGLLKARLRDGSLELFEHADLSAELRRLRTRHTPGRSSVVNPRVGRSHGDLAQSLALAVFEHDRYGLGGDTGTWEQSQDGPGAISAGLADLEPGFTAGDPSRRRKWFDDKGDSIADRKF